MKRASSPWNLYRHSGGVLSLKWPYFADQIQPYLGENIPLHKNSTHNQGWRPKVSMNFSVWFLFLQYLRPLQYCWLMDSFIFCCVFKRLFCLLCFVVCRVSNSLCKVSLYSAGGRGGDNHNVATPARNMKLIRVYNVEMLKFYDITMPQCCNVAMHHNVATAALSAQCRTGSFGNAWIILGNQFWTNKLAAIWMEH